MNIIQPCYFVVGRKRSLLFCLTLLLLCLPTYAQTVIYNDLERRQNVALALAKQVAQTTLDWHDPSNKGLLNDGDEGELFIGEVFIFEDFSWFLLRQNQNLEDIDSSVLQQLRWRYGNAYVFNIHHPEHGCLLTMHGSSIALCSRHSPILTEEAQQRLEENSLVLVHNAAQSRNSLVPQGETATYFYLSGEQLLDVYTGDVYEITTSSGNVINPLTANTQISIESAHTYKLGWGGVAIEDSQKQIWTLRHSLVFRKLDYR